MYLEDHIPGASFVDVERELSVLQPAGTVGGRRPLPSSEAFAEVAGRVGIGEESRRRLRPGDERRAARLWWLSVISGDDVAVLDGGIGAWLGPLRAGEEEIEGLASRRASGSKTRSARRLEARLGDDGLVVVDARPGAIPRRRRARRPGRRPHPGRAICRTPATARCPTSS